MKKSHAGEIAYLPEDDTHLPQLTVGETLTFAASARTPHTRLGTREEALAETRDVLLSLFGLAHTVNTKVGNDIVRGVSGGERKRVSIAEMVSLFHKKKNRRFQNLKLTFFFLEPANIKTLDYYYYYF